MLFLDPDKTIATCTAEHCDVCAVREKRNCHFSSNQLLHFLVLVFPSFLLGDAGVYHVNSWWLIPWLVVIVAYSGFVEIRVMCSHCPHYAEEGGSLKCWANYGAPKLWKYRPGPMVSWEKAIFFRWLCTCLGLSGHISRGWASGVSAGCLSPFGHGLFPDVEDVSLFPVHEFRLSAESGQR